jgi:hypothetical protein
MLPIKLNFPKDARHLGWLHQEIEKKNTSKHYWPRNVPNKACWRLLRVFHKNKHLDMNNEFKQKMINAFHFVEKP